MSFPEHWPPLIGDMWQNTTTDELWMCAGSVGWIDGTPKAALWMIAALGAHKVIIEDWYERTEGHVVLVYRDGVKS